MIQPMIIMIHSIKKPRTEMIKVKKEEHEILFLMGAAVFLLAALIGSFIVRVEGLPIRYLFYIIMCAEALWVGGFLAFILTRPTED